MRYVGHPLPLLGPAGLGLKESRVGLKTTESTFRAGTPRLLFEGRYDERPRPRANYEITPDGQQFVMIKESEEQEEAPTQITVVLNWCEELKERAPTN